MKNARKRSSGKGTLGRSPKKHKVDGESSTKRGRRKPAEESDLGESAKSEDDDALEEEEETEKKHFTFKDEDHEEDSDSDTEEEKKKKSAKKLSRPSSKKDSKVGVSIFCVSLSWNKSVGLAVKVLESMWDRSPYVKASGICESFACLDCVSTPCYGPMLRHSLL